LKGAPAMLFIDNKYTNWYYEIIHNAQNRIATGYIEKHHIIPRSLGGSNELSNIVRLTAREHYICHYLLTKMTTSKDKIKMFHALRFLNANNKKSSRIYEYIKINLFSKNNIEMSIKRSAMPAEVKKKISDKMKGRPAHNMGKTQIHKRHKIRSDSPSIGSNGKLKGLVRPRLCCISCKKEVDIANLTKYHSH